MILFQSMGYSEKKIAVCNDIARDDFYFYARWMMLRRHDMVWMRGAHHEKICNALMRVYRGECRRLIINIPPRYSKTQLVTDFITWGLGRHTDSEFMYLSYSASLAHEKTGDALLDVMDPCYREIFPKLKLTSTRAGHWKTSDHGVVYASGTEGTITGFGAGKKRPGFAGALIVDDPHKPDEVFGPVREKVIANFKRTVANRLNSPMTTPIILIMQCLHEEDLSQFLREGKNGEEWECLSLPAINEDGTALWPEMHSIESLKVMQEFDNYTFSGQYMQKPTPVGGAWFREQDFLIPSEDGLDWIGVPVPQKVDSVFCIIDSATKTGNEHDGLGAVYFAYTPHIGRCLSRLTIIDWDLTQIDGAFLINWIPMVFERLEQLSIETNALMGNAGVHIEDKNSGTILLQQCAANPNFAGLVQAIDSGLTSVGKVERGLNISGHVRAGEVKITRHAYEKSVSFKKSARNHLMSQILRFTPSVADMGADDLFDGFTYGTALSLGNRMGY